MNPFALLKNRRVKKEKMAQNRSKPAVESLEDRLLLASSLFGGVTTQASFNNYSLTYGVDGTNNDDTITIDYGSGTYFKPVVVTVKNGNQVVRRSTFWSVPREGLVIRGLDGHDTITNNTSLPMKIYGGKGDDTVIGGSATDRIYGEAGNDRLEGRGGTDYLYGGLHDDDLFGGEGRDYLYGQSGSDYLDGGQDGINEYLYGGSGKDTFQQYAYIRCSVYFCDYDDPAAVEDRAGDLNRAEGDYYTTENVEIYY